MLLVALVLAGIVLRVAVFLRPDPLFVDEAMLAHAVATRPWADLVPPFTYQQVAPPGVLWLARLTTTPFGMSEHALRIGAFAAGVAALILFAFHARKLLPAWPAAIATGLVALSPAAIRYSDEFKQYGFDLLVAVLVLGATARVLAKPDRAGWRGWTAIGVAGLLFSTAAPVVLAGAWLALLVAPRDQLEGRGPRLVEAALVWGVLGLVILLGWYGDTDTPYLRHFWADGYLDPGPGWFDRFRAAIAVADTLAFRSLLPVPVEPILLLIGIAAASHWLTRPRFVLGVAMVAPIPLAVVASMLHRYPIAERTMLFALPALALGTGGALVRLAGSARTPLRWTGYALGLLALVGPTVALWRWHGVVVPPGGVRIAAERIRRQRWPVWVDIRAMPEFLFYSTDWNRPDLTRLDRFGTLADSIGPNAGNNPPRDHAVEPSGDALRFRDGARELLVGLPSGMEVTGNGVVNATRPDTGWAANEARRLAAVGGDGALLLLARSRRAALESLVAALRDRRGIVDTLFSDRIVQLLRVRWGAPTGSVAPARS